MVVVVVVRQRERESELGSTTRRRGEGPRTFFGGGKKGERFE